MMKLDRGLDALASFPMIFADPRLNTEMALNQILPGVALLIHVISFPLSRIEDQSLPWGICFTSASEGQESHLHEAQVIKDLAIFALHS
jgi:hypothetical protein